MDDGGLCTNFLEHENPTDFLKFYF
jgi:hypothetical protein